MSKDTTAEIFENLAKVDAYSLENEAIDYAIKLGTTSAGQTILHYAARYGNEDLASALVERVKNTFIRKKDIYGYTALQYAAAAGKAAIVEDLWRAPQADKNQALVIAVQAVNQKNLDERKPFYNTIKALCAGGVSTAVVTKLTSKDEIISSWIQKVKESVSVSEAQPAPQSWVARTAQPEESKEQSVAR